MQNEPENGHEQQRLSDQSLLLACRAGDQQAWEKLLNQYERLVYSIPRNYGLSQDDAADIAQLTFTALLESLDSIQDGQRLGAWLATVARRHSWRMIERGKREQSEAVAPIPETAPLLGRPNDDQIERWELTEWLHRGLSLLNERCRELLIALYFKTEKPQYAEISEHIGIPVGSVGPTRARCLERMRQILEPMEES